jgi:hypothetical protein
VIRFRVLYLNFKVKIKMKENFFQKKSVFKM